MELGRKSEGRELRDRFVWLGVFFMAGLMVLAINLYRLMVVRYDEFKALSVDNQFKDVRVRAPRGEIRDVRGELLVNSRPSFDVFVTPAFCQKCSAEVLPMLAELLEWDEATRTRIEQQIKFAHGPQRYQPMVVQVDLDEGGKSRDLLDRVSSHLYQLPGVSVEVVPHRNYRAGTVLAHVLGYMNEITQDELKQLNGSSEAERLPYALGDYIGRRGVERAFESELRGTDGWRQEVVNARGEVMRNMPLGKSVPPVAGHKVVLSIDAKLQAEAERVFPGQAGAIIALESKTGFILAMVSRPAFDPNVLTGRVSASELAAMSRDPLQPMVFRAVQEHYHPGSTFKVVPMLAALKSGVFSPHTQVFCPGHYTLGNRTWRCHKEAGHGTVEARTALQWSCDTYFYKVADLLGIDAIAEEGKLLGLGAPTGFNIAAEVPGVMPDSAYHNRVTPGGYTKGLSLNTAIGQGDVNVTPLQLALLYTAVGNGGLVFEPQVVRRIEDSDGHLLREMGPKLVRHIEIPDEHRQLVVDALTAVVNEPGGTAFRSRLKDVVVAGKTGTAQVARLGSVRLKKEAMDYFERDHAWFAAFAPAGDPELTVVVLNEHGGHGGSDAAPAAAAIIQKYFELRKADGATFNPEVSPQPVVRKPVLPPRPVLPVAESAKPSAAPVAEEAVDAGAVPGWAGPSPSEPAEVQ